MHKLLLTIVSFFCVFSLCAQEKYDVRKSNWGMTLKEVLASEYPLIPSKTTDHSLHFSNVELSNGSSAYIWYSFTNGKLTEVNYELKGYNAEDSRGTCEKIIPLYKKIGFTRYVFESLKSKSFICDMGWYFPALDCKLEGKSIFKTSKCGSIEKEFVEAVDLKAKECGSVQVALGLANSRSKATFYFNEYQNTKYKIESYYPCNDDMYNVYYRLHFEPTFQLKRQMKQNDF